MTNREWLNSIDNKAMAKKIVPPHCECEYCIINANCNHIAGDCINKLVEWLRAKHEKPMPEIKAGDLLFYGKESYYVAITPDKLVTLRGYVVVDLENAIRNDSIIAVSRYTDGTLTTIWRADNGNQ